MVSFAGSQCNPATARHKHSSERFVGQGIFARSTSGGIDTRSRFRTTSEPASDLNAHPVTSLPSKASALHFKACYADELIAQVTAGWDIEPTEDRWHRAWLGMGHAPRRNGRDPESESTPRNIPPHALLQAKAEAASVGDRDCLAERTRFDRLVAIQFPGCPDVHHYQNPGRDWRPLDESYRPFSGMKATAACFESGPTA
jgi:hypothetical protein